MADLLAWGLIFGGVAIAGAGYYGLKPKGAKNAALVVGIVALVAGVALAAGLLSISAPTAGAPAAEGVYSVLFSTVLADHTIAGSAAEAPVVAADQHKVTFFDTKADFAAATIMSDKASILNSNVGQTTDLHGFTAKVTTVPSVNVPPSTPMGALKADGVTWNIAYTLSGAVGTFSGQQQGDKFVGSAASGASANLVAAFTLNAAAAGAVTVGSSYDFVYTWGGVGLTIEITITS